MTFHDVVGELERNVVGCHVEVTISRSGVESDEYEPIAHFEGDADAIGESITRGRGVQLRIKLSPEHKGSRAMIELARDDFVSAEIGDQGDEPWDLEVRQSSVVISLSVYPRPYSGETEPGTQVGDPDPPF